jgi:purine-binding chemotaxis protein CheW
MKKKAKPPAPPAVRRRAPKPAPPSAMTLAEARPSALAQLSATELAAALNADTPAAPATPPALPEPAAPAPAPAPLSHLEPESSAVRDESLASEIDTRPLRERVRSRRGVAELLMFRVGRELYAADLAAVEEAVELGDVRALPEMPPGMLGVFALRGRMTPLYSPAPALGVALGERCGVALLVRAGRGGAARHVGLAIDDVEDVLAVNLATLRDPPLADGADGLLLGLARRGAELVAVIDAEALVTACLSGRALETA